MEIRAMMPEARTRALRTRRRMRRVRRGVGMKGTGRIMTRIVVRTESARVRVLWAVKFAAGNQLVDVVAEREEVVIPFFVDKAQG
jgi:hypothetical protein